MRKIKTILLIVVLGMLFISCSDEVMTLSVDGAKLEQARALNDTTISTPAGIKVTRVTHVQITEGDKTDHYKVTEDGRLTPDFRVMRNTPIKILIACLFLLMGFGIGMAVGSD